MKIVDIKLYVLENGRGTRRIHRITEVPGLRRTQYTHRGGSEREGPVRQSFIEVVTDEGISSRMPAGLSAGQVELLKEQVVGENPFHREKLYQKLHKGTRWVYQQPGWFGEFDNCLWDIAGKAGGLPCYALIGRVRERFPAYLTGGDMDLEGYLRHIEQGKECGIQAYKFHSYKGGKADIPIYREVRDAVGPEYALITDPVCSYDLREAIEVGHVLEELDFVWLEEPMHEQKMNQYQELCRELTIPVMGTETLMHDIGISSQWLIQGATDRLRARSTFGATQVLKLAHLAELYGTNIEMNGLGSMFGLAHAHLGCCIDNTDFYEFTGGRADVGRRTGESWGMMNGIIVEEGHIGPPDGPGWGAEWDEERFRSLVVEEH